MDVETLEALNGSIEKWQKIVDGTGRDDGTDNCPLCLMFFHNDCRDCPVREKTGQINCYGTPYDRFESISGYAQTEDQKQVAQEELDFLKSLHPNK